MDDARYPCPHSRPDYRMCPWCMGLNDKSTYDGEFTITTDEDSSIKWVTVVSVFNGSEGDGVTQ